MKYIKITCNYLIDNRLTGKYIVIRKCEDELYNQTINESKHLIDLSLEVISENKDSIDKNYIIEDITLTQYNNLVDETIVEEFIIDNQFLNNEEQNDN